MKKFKSHHQEQSSFKKMTIAYCTAFIAGFCVMVIEIVAGRLIARFLGVSLYTWTSVIGVVLAGISLGYYVGGRIADRYPPQITLSKLFIAASITCLLVPVLNNLMGAFPIVLRLSWPVRITLHVAILFFLPSTFLGMISPVVAKFALDQGLGTGRTIGNIYACGSGGSIAGTFVAGFFLIASMGSVAVIWTIAGILTAVGVFYSKRGRLAYAWLTVFAFLVFVSFSDAAWAKTMAVGLFLSEPRQEELVYAKDSQYSYIRILENTKKPGICEFKLDNLVQTKMKIGEPANLKYAYGCHRIFGGIVRNPNFNKEDLSVLHLGGGGYLFPRYVEKVFPKSRNEVIEIDPEATKAAIKAFGLSEESGIVIHHSDVRNYVEDLLRRKRRGEDIQLFDLIYCDVFLGGVAVPYHLVTYEINQKIALLLKPGGRYVLNLVDSKTSPRFLNAMIHTLRESFPSVAVIIPEQPSHGYGAYVGYGTYVVIASFKEIDRSYFVAGKPEGRLLSQDELEMLRSGPPDSILTDDFAPVDNLLREVFCLQGERAICRPLMESAEDFLEQDKLEEAISRYKKALAINPDFVEAYSNIGSLNARQGRYDEAITYYTKALSIEPKYKPAMIGLAGALDRKGDISEAIEMYYKVLAVDPDLADVNVSLGNIFFRGGEINGAIQHYKKALEIEPALEAAQKNLEIALGQEGKSAEKPAQAANPSDHNK